MRLLVVTVSIDRSECALCRDLAAAGIDTEVMCRPGTAAIPVLREDDIPVTPITIRHRLDLRAVRRIRHRLMAKEYDLIYAPSNKSLSTSLLASRGLSVRHVAYRGTIGHLSRCDPAGWLTYFHPRVDRIVCVSEAVRGYLLSKRIAAAKLVTIHKGHDTAWYGGPGRSALTGLGIPAGAFVVGFAGTIRPVKGVDVLLRATLLLSGDVDIRFLLVGTMRDRRVRRLLERSDIQRRVHVTGFRADAADLMGACDICVMPSVAREGLPRAVIEAMAQSVPVIVTDTGGMPELVVHGESGLVVPPRDADALAAAIQSLAGSPDQANLYGRKAKERIQDRFSIGETVAKTARLFRQVCASDGD